MHGFGPVQREENEPTFHAPWEGSVLAMVEAALAQRLFNLDEFRHGIERMDPTQYLASSYYEHWLATLETNLVEKGILTTAELDGRTVVVQENPAYPLPRRDDPDLLARILAGAPKMESPSDGRPAPRFGVGDRVTARNVHPRGHTRLPRYVRGKRGVIARVHGIDTFPDTNAHGLGPQPQALYSVCFDGRELWGESAEPRERLYIDLWDSYLDPA
jgi:nitrile hydratase